MFFALSPYFAQLESVGPEFQYYKRMTKNVKQIYGYAMYTNPDNHSIYRAVPHFL